MTEIWKDIEDYPNYQVSNLGRIKSLPRVVDRRNGRQLRLKERILKQGQNKSGYFHINLWENKSSKSTSVHKLVAVAFIPNPFNKKTVNHKDGNKSNNRTENLEWMTQSENNKHAFDTKLKNADSLKKKVLMLSKDNKPLLWFDSMTEASEMSGVNPGSISHCCLGQQKIAGGYKWQYYGEVSV